jgi:hypothetical protein
MPAITLEVGHCYLVRHPYDPYQAWIIKIIDVAGDYIHCRNEITNTKEVLWAPAIDIVREMASKE